MWNNWSCRAWIASQGSGQKLNSNSNTVDVLSWSCEVHGPSYGLLCQFISNYLCIYHFGRIFFKAYQLLDIYAEISARRNELLIEKWIYEVFKITTETLRWDVRNRPWRNECNLQENTKTFRNSDYLHCTFYRIPPKINNRRFWNSICYSSKWTTETFQFSIDILVSFFVVVSFTLNAHLSPHLKCVILNSLNFIWF